ncbi:UDP-N-acetylmuramoyl-L-alanyl-D-glutamate--2,6-diaminopimelate ligase [Oceanobacillus sp. CAU 1775]
MKLSELTAVLPFLKHSNIYDAIEIDSLAIDSRKVKPGSLFICLRGLQTDGHLFIEDAIRNGAAAIIMEEPMNLPIPCIQVNDTSTVLAKIVNKFYEYPTSSLDVTGITGTNGKTTVSYLLEAIYEKYEKKTGVIGTIQNKIGDTIFNTSHTTPDIVELQRIFYKMKKENVDQVIMEVSSHALDMGRVHGTAFDTVVFTNITQDHLDYHENPMYYFYAKSLLFSQLGNTYEGNRKYAIINADDTETRRLKKATAQHIVTYGINHEADVKASDIQLNATHTKFRLKTPVGTVKITSRLIGKFNIYNMLAASSAAIVNGVPLEIIQSAFESKDSIPGRFETIDEGQDFTVIVDYAHTPNALENTLMTGKQLTKGRLITVVGCGGDRDRSKRGMMAKTAVDFSDVTIFTADNPRSEDPKEIIREMVSGLDKQFVNFEIEVDRKLAIKRALSIAKANDILIIAGKGHETYQEIAGKKYAFDDRETVRKLLNS